MAKDKVGKRLLIVTPTGNEYVFQKTIVLFYAGRPEPYVDKAWGSEELLRKIMYDPKLQGITTKGSGVMVARPFESGQWITKDEPIVEPKSSKDKFLEE